MTNEITAAFAYEATVARLELESYYPLSVGMIAKAIKADDSGLVAAYRESLRMGFKEFHKHWIQLGYDERREELRRIKEGVKNDQ